MRLAIHSQLGPYAIAAPLGAGGMGEVYRARDARLQRDVAIKVVPEQFAQDANALARFSREVRAVEALSHPNIVTIHDVGTEQGLTYAVMELLEGHTLRRQIKQGPMDWFRRWKSPSELPTVCPRRTPRELSTGTSSRRISSSRPTAR